MAAAYKNVRVSDISGEVLPENEVVSMVVRQAPGLDKPRQLDCSPAEVARLVRLEDIVELEITHEDGRLERAICTMLAFSELVPPDVLEAAPSNRGRRPGQKPADNGA